MTSDALAMICTEQSWRVQLSRIEWFAVATLTQRWQHAERAVMMTPLANHVLMSVEVARNLASLDVFQESVDDLPVR
jgi:hypothetical protein